MLLPVDAELGPAAIVDVDGFPVVLLGQDGWEGIVQALQLGIAAGEGVFAVDGGGVLGGGDLPEVRQVVEERFLHLGIGEVGVAVVVQLDSAVPPIFAATGRIVGSVQVHPLEGGRSL